MSKQKSVSLTIAVPETMLADLDRVRLAQPIPPGRAQVVRTLLGQWIERETTCCSCDAEVPPPGTTWCPVCEAENDAYTAGRAGRRCTHHPVDCECCDCQRAWRLAEEARHQAEEAR